MPAPASRSVLLYRWFVFLLALGFWLYQFDRFPLATFGWQFRYLTIWGLTANLVVAGMMLRLSLGRSEKTHDAFVAAAVVLGVLVVFMYWKLYFTNPALVNAGGKPMPWYQEYYLHAGTQVLMMFDAFFILGVFWQIWKTLVTLMVILIGYILWIEIFVKTLNSFPEGSATSGLPYPFLNDMGFWPRMGFYAATIVTAIIFLLAGWGLSKLLAREHAGIND